MYQRKLMKKQIEESGLRLGDGCNILPFHGKKKSFTLNRTKLDLISEKYRPHDLAMSYIELPNTSIEHFHYRLETQDERYLLKTIKGDAFWLNGTAVREAYIEREDRLFIDDNKIHFTSFGLGELIERNVEHPLLLETKLVESNLKILIEGETGTGKTYLASRIHEKSGRVGNFVSVNLSSFNPQLIESELFGHKKGAFTGAVADKQGAFKISEYGTLFLDEVDSLPLEIQTKLLGFLDDNKFRPVGDTMVHTIRTRVIFASGRSLENLVQQGKFRKDFYFRLKSGHTVKLPSLRNEPQKIQDAVQRFCITAQITCSKRLLDFYQTLLWPGNLRHLYGHLEKKRVLSRSSKLDFDYLDEELLLQSSDLETISTAMDLIPLKDFKNDYVKKAMGICEGNISMTARKLQITEKTVKSLLKGA